jgi:hypothetical protein
MLGFIIMWMLVLCALSGWVDAAPGSHHGECDTLTHMMLA